MLDLDEVEYVDGEEDFDVDDDAPLTSDRQQEIEDAHVDDGLARRVDEAFERLRRRAEAPKREGRGVLLIGPSGTGKSHALKQLTLREEFQVRETPDGIVRPMLKVSAPAPCTLKTLGREIYRRLTGVEMRYRIEEHEIWSRVRAHLAAQKVKYLFIDEAHHTLIGRKLDEQRKVAETFKTIMQMPEWPVYLVLAGMPETLPFVLQNRQLSRRMIKMQIKRLPRGEVGDRAIRKHSELLIAKLGITVDFDLDAMAPRLHVASDGYLGTCAQLLKDATELALEAGAPSVGAEDLADAYSDLHVAGGGNIDDETNPFLCSDLSLVQRPEDEQRSRETGLKGKGSIGGSKSKS